jgi:hypothetical protein
MADSNVVPIKPNTKIKPGAEYVSGSPYAVDMPRVLPQYEENLRVGGKAYLTHQLIDEMLCDPDVFAALMLLSLMALSEEILITPAVTESTTEIHSKEPLPDVSTELPTEQKDNVPAAGAVGSPDAAKPTPKPANPKVQRAKEIADFCKYNYNRVPKLAAVIFSMCFEGMAHGNKAAEQVLEIGATGDYAGKWLLQDLKPKPRESIAFVVDAYMNELGLIGAKPGQMAVTLNTFVPDSNDIIPREKFAVFTYRPKDKDPRGDTALQAALNGWDMKRRTFPEYLLFLMVSAIPGIIATLDPAAGEITVYEDDGLTPRKDADGNVITVEAHQFLLSMLGKMRNHQVGVAPAGTQFTMLQSNNKGEAFTQGLTTFSKEITMGMLFQHLATRDSEHQTKSSTGEQANVLDYIVWWLRDTLADMVRYDIFKPLVRYNFGDEDANELLPVCSYGDTDARSWAVDATAAGSLFPYATESQIDFLFTQLGIPLPTEAERAFKNMAKALSQQGQKAALQDSGDNTGDNSANNDKQPGNAAGKAGNDKAPATTNK